MKAFFYILLIGLSLSGSDWAQGTTIKLGDVLVTVDRSKWEKGAMANLRAPEMFNTNQDNPGLPGGGSLANWRPATPGYYYQADFTNQNGEKIKGILWEYVFLDIVTKEELGRHKIFSKTSIKKGETDTVATFRTRPPSGTISAEAVGEKDRSKQYLERIEIKAVLFSDGALWQHKDTSERDCNRLRVVVKRGRIFR